MAQGYRTELWTTQRIADVIATHFGVRHHRDHVGRLMSQLEWSRQRPEYRALELEIGNLAPHKKPPAGRPPRVHRRNGLPPNPACP